VSQFSWGEAPIIFLAMFWGGGGPYTIPQIMWVYDWINRAVPNRDEMESALNALLAAGLVQETGGKFLLPRGECRKFDAFRKKKRKDRFDVARLYFRALPRPVEISRVVRLTANEYKSLYKEYERSFWEEFNK